MSIFYAPQDSKHLKVERQKARELRASSWWKQKLNEGICYYCEGKFAASDLTMDHKVPLARGGKSTKGNCVLACKECNTEKKHLTPAEMLLQESTLENFSQE